MNHLPAISFGFDVRQPDRLETWNTHDVLSGIQYGRWRIPVCRVRSLPANSCEQKEAKLALPYACFSGTFLRRWNSGLLDHSGQMGIDLDGLGTEGAVRVLQMAVADPHCLAAFRSARHEGVHLIIRIPRCRAHEHSSAFEQVSDYVRGMYGVEPDSSGSDVARASFVSFDNGLWLNLSATVLPVNTGAMLHSSNTTVYQSPPPDAAFIWYGRNLANPSAVRADGTAATHKSLLGLGKALALHSDRTGLPLTQAVIDKSFGEWRHVYEKAGVRFRNAVGDYRRELDAILTSATRTKWFKKTADFWLRWTRHKKFPHDSGPEGKILFAVRQHCAESGAAEFFLSARDAATIAGCSPMSACRALAMLVQRKYICRAGERINPRHAQSFLLSKP